MLSTSNSSLLRPKLFISEIDSIKTNWSIAATTQENSIIILIVAGITALPKADLDHLRRLYKALWITRTFWPHLPGAALRQYPDIRNNPGLCPGDFGQLDVLIGLLHHCLRPAPARSHACVARCIGETHRTCESQFCSYYIFGSSLY